MQHDGRRLQRSHDGQVMASGGHLLVAVLQWAMINNQRPGSGICGSWVRSSIDSSLEKMQVVAAARPVAASVEAQRSSTSSPVGATGSDCHGQYDEWPASSNPGLAGGNKTMTDVFLEK
ncbi:hypothetical protein ACLOJK_040770 [Asimina triloba]